MPRGSSQPPRSSRAAAGLLASALALGFDWGLHRAITDVPFAPFALADRIVRLTPGSIATWMIDHLHHAAKTLLAGGSVVALLMGGAGVALLVRRGPRAAAAFGALVLTVGALEPVQATLWGAVAGGAIVGAGYGLALAALGALAIARVAPWRRPLDPGRRRALARLGELLLAGAALNALAPLIGGQQRVRLLEFAATPLRGRPSFPRIGQLTPEVTSVADHYIVDIDISKPVVDAGSWRLSVDGLVKRPLALGFDQLQERFELVSEYAVLACISNPVGGPLVGNSLWEGVRLRDLLDAARTSPQAWGLEVKCADGYSAGIPLAAARHEASMVAIAQDGQSLTREHGFPCRLRVPALYGMLNPKWVTEVRVVQKPYVGYWAQQGWSRTAVVRTEARIDTPGSARAGEPIWIAGIAWAGIRGIAEVEVSTDGGQSWHQALLHEPLSPWAWTQWAYRWTPSQPGRHELLCRATDRQHHIQDAMTRPPHPTGASGYPRRVVSVT
jgi:DMSO/TMAO reductase YedYZ molybdopterin-dependent catalytic subunit